MNETPESKVHENRKNALMLRFDEVSGEEHNSIASLLANSEMLTLCSDIRCASSVIHAWAWPENYSRWTARILMI